MKKIVLIAGARPNYMKIYPLWWALKETSNFQPLIIHTGQHYDHQMSKIFFDDLGLPDPDFYLGVGSGSHGEQTGKVMIALEPVLKEQKPEMVVVVGDVNSTIAAAVVAVKMGIPVAHVEAGLRSFDRTMPEEINRILTDTISDLLFTSCPDGDENLKHEGVPSEKIFFVGNVMIDSLVTFLPKADHSKILETLQVEAKKYIVTTLHRPVNVDDPQKLSLLLEKLNILSELYPVVFPVHPRTQKMIESFGLITKTSRIKTIGSLGYIDFLRLMSQSVLTITDSGGIQEETTFLGIPCLTLRSNTERPITIAQGTNKLIDLNQADFKKEAAFAVEKFRNNVPQINKWDGKAAERILRILENYLIKK